MAHQRGNLLKTPPRRQLAKVRPKSPGRSQVSCCRVRAGPLLGGDGWAREGGGRSGSLGSRRREREPVCQSANGCTSPNSRGSSGRGRGSWSPGPAADPTRRLALLQEGAEGASAEPKSALRSSGCRRCPSPAPVRAAGRGRGRARPAGCPSAGSPEPSPREAARQ